MAVLLEERKALALWVEEQDQTAFDVFIGTHVPPWRISDFSSALHPMQLVAFHFTEWFEKQHPAHMTLFLNAVVQLYPGHPSTPTLTALMQKLARIPAANAPWNSSLPRGVPVVNRTPLRVELQRLLQPNNWRALVLVHGTTKMGKSISWNLIQHVGQNTNTIKPTMVDVAESTPSAVFDAIVTVASLQVIKPTEAGISGTTLAKRYADVLCDAWAPRTSNVTVWVVLDNVQKPSSPEMGALVVELGQRAIASRLPGCVLFLLGADRNYGFDDPKRLAGLESLAICSINEADASVDAIHEMGTTKLAASILGQYKQKLHHLIATLPPEEAFGAISDVLVELRDRVGA